MFEVAARGICLSASFNNNSGLWTLDCLNRLPYHPFMFPIDDSLTGAKEIASAFGLDPHILSPILERYPALINDYYHRLCLREGRPLSRQVVPDPLEIHEKGDILPEDPVGEETHSPVLNLSHRYEDRVLFLISDVCPVYCRFCTRKRKVGRILEVTGETVSAGIRYIESQPKVRDVLLSGGDPLMLEDAALDSILVRLKRIEHVQILRIGSRVPAALPRRVTPELASLLSRHGPLFVHTHFNHPAEITREARDACRHLVDAGVPLANQTVLLRGVNDNVDTLENLFRGLLTMRVRPYYLFQADMVRGTAHFRTTLSAGISIIEELRRRTSPMALPLFAVDLPGGAGKAFPSPPTVLHPGTPDQAVVTPSGARIPYPDPE